MINHYDTNRKALVINYNKMQQYMTQTPKGNTQRHSSNTRTHEHTHNIHVIALVCTEM